MKSIILIFSVFLSFTSCSDDKKAQETSIIGTWKLIETYGSDGGSNPQWIPVKDGYSYTFNSNGTYTSTRFSECSTGEYTITESTLTLDYDCAGFDTGIENPPGTFIENYVFENQKIILTPTYLNCDEGCGYKFEKVE